MQKLSSKFDTQSQSLRHVSLWLSIMYGCYTLNMLIAVKKTTTNVGLDGKSFKSLISISAIIQLKNYWGISETDSHCFTIKSSETLIDHTLCCCSSKVFHWQRKNSLLICGHRHKCLECTYRLCQFGKMVAVTSASSSRTSQARVTVPEWFSLVERVLSSV